MNKLGYISAIGVISISAVLLAGPVQARMTTSGGVHPQEKCYYCVDRTVIVPNVEHLGGRCDFAESLSRNPVASTTKAWIKVGNTYYLNDTDCMTRLGERTRESASSGRVFQGDGYIRVGDTYYRTRNNPLLGNTDNRIFLDEDSIQDRNGVGFTDDGYIRTGDSYLLTGSNSLLDDSLSRNRFIDTYASDSQVGFSGPFAVQSIPGGYVYTRTNLADRYYSNSTVRY